MTRLARLMDHVATRASLAIATHRLGLLTLEVTALRVALEHERDDRKAAEARCIRWRDRLGAATAPPVTLLKAQRLRDTVRAILDE